MTDDDDLRTEVRELRSEVDALQRRLGRLESILDSDTLPEEQHTQERDPDRTHTREHAAVPRRRHYRHKRPVVAITPPQTRVPTRGMHAQGDRPLDRFIEV